MDLVLAFIEIESVGMAFRYALRTDKAFEKVRDFITSKGGISGWSVREVSGDNEHWHWYLETDLKVEAFRAALTRAVPTLKGNAGYSISQVKDQDKYLRYMSKGESDGTGPNVAWKHGLLWTEEKLEELHQAYWEENRRLKKRKVGTVMDYVMDQCKAEQIKWEDRRTITEYYIKELVKRDKPVNLFSLKSNVNLIQCKLCPDDSAIGLLLNLAALPQ